MNQRIKRPYSWAFFFLAVGYFAAVSISFFNIFSGSIPFWFDPARDILTAWENMHKITLIGPPSGIPGFFYGPYWIWLLQLALLVSKNPRVIAFLVQALPYLIIMPILTAKLSRYFGSVLMSSLAILFLITCNRYVTQLWNPHLAPLLFLVMVYLLIKFTDTRDPRKQLAYLFAASMMSGLIVNFHFSFGIGVFIGTILYILVMNVLQYRAEKPIISRFRSVCIQYALFTSGFIIIFLPFFIFEVRHQYHQLVAIITAIRSPYAVVGVAGIHKIDIVRLFLSGNGTFLGISEFLGFIIGILFWVMGLFIFLTRKKGRWHIQEMSFLIIFLLALGLCSVYFWTKNPVWSYHFISTEVIYLILVAFIGRRFKLFRYTLYFWTVCVVVVSLLQIFTSFKRDPFTIPSLVTKEHIVKTVIADAGITPFSILVFNPSIYTYDYSFLFKWLARKDVPYDPGSITTLENTVYLIIPSNESLSFVQVRTPDPIYKTETTKIFPDGTIVVKRVKQVL